jgi:hypothetical protein
VTEERYDGLNLTRPEEGFELYRHKNVENTRRMGGPGCTGQAQRGWRLRDPNRHPGGRSVLSDGRRLPEGGLRGALLEGDSLTLEPLI